jgi:hypothetical protein
VTHFVDDGPHATTGLSDRLPRAPTHLLHDFVYLVAHPEQERFEDLWVAVDSGEHPADDRGNPIEPYLEHRLRLDALDVQHDLAESNIRSDVEPEQVQHVRFQRHPRPQVINLEVDLLDLELRHVEQHVRLAGRLGCQLLVAVQVFVFVFVFVVGGLRGLAVA